MMPQAALFAEEELDDELMRSVEDTNKALASDLAQSDPQASLSDARDLQSNFLKVKEYFVARLDAREGVDLCTKSLDLTAEIIRLVSVRDFTAATISATDLSRTCKKCHNLYKKEH